MVQLYANGDCLYATAIARQIKQDFPGCHLTWMIADFCQGIVDGNPYIDEVLVTNAVKKNDIKAYRRVKKTLTQEKEQGKWTEIFFTQTMDDNQALYDGTIRGMLFRSYPSTITVPVQPVLILNEHEKERVAAFASAHRLQDFKYVLLWEYAPQSGQSAFNFEFVMRVAQRITAAHGVCVILSSANKFEGTSSIIDASTLTVRENAALTHYCSLLVGCSSGITWLSTSSAAKQLPMLQLLDGYAYFRNAPSVDFARYNIPADELIELVEFDEEKTFTVIKAMIDHGTANIKKDFNQPLPVQFRTTRKIVYNLLCYAQFKAIARHYRVTVSVYGRHPLFIREFIGAMLLFPFKLIRNKIRKM